MTEQAIHFSTTSSSNKSRLFRIEINAFNLPAGVCPGSLVPVVAFRLMIPPLLIPIRRGWQFRINYSFDLFKGKNNFSLIYR